MAKALNRTRIRDTKLILLLCFVLIVSTRPLIEVDSVLHELFDLVGELLVAVCVVGRVYCTAFLGGHKNQTLVSSGPFSVSRNPLYFCSFIGICGIALMSNHLVLVALIPMLFLVVYFALIAREEATLQQLFGADYATYCAATPRFWPRLAPFQAPDEMVVSPKLLGNAVKDGLLWFLVLPIFELIEYAQRAGIIHPWFTLY